MFEYLSVYDRILVTGPQRSGTRVAAKMIAHDTGHTFIDERKFGVRDRDKFAAMVAKRHKSVIQCPAFCYCIHEHVNDDTLIMLMIRNLDEIVASERRINWKVGPYFELENYGLTGDAAYKFRHCGGRIADIKYSLWLTAQRSQVPHYLELEYTQLEKHPLWIPKSQRKDFEPEQTKL